jgi:hypothetical protein
LDNRPFRGGRGLGVAPWSEPDAGVFFEAALVATDAGVGRLDGGLAAADLLAFGTGKALGFD